MNLNEILSAVEKRKNPKRRGRGEGSGLGKSAGRGNKGAKARSGWRRRYGYEGGQMPLSRRLPKRGFVNVNFATYFDVVNVGTLGDVFDDGATVDMKALIEKGVLKPRFGNLKVLGEGELRKKLSVVAHRASESARKKIEAAGGTLKCLLAPRKVWKPVPKPGAVQKPGEKAPKGKDGVPPADGAAKGKEKKEKKEMKGKPSEPKAQAPAGEAKGGEKAAKKGEAKS